MPSLAENHFSLKHGGSVITKGVVVLTVTRTNAEVELRSLVLWSVSILAQAHTSIKSVSTC